MSDLRLVVVGAPGRMGRMLTQVVPDTLGVRLVAALAPEGDATLGADSGAAFGQGPNGVPVTSDVAAAIAQAVQRVSRRLSVVVIVFSWSVVVIVA